jgi:hypothetical protein
MPTMQQLRTRSNYCADDTNYTFICNLWTRYGSLQALSEFCGRDSLTEGHVKADMKVLHQNIMTSSPSWNNWLLACTGNRKPKKLSACMSWRLAISIYKVIQLFLGDFPCLYVNRSIIYHYTNIYQYRLNVRTVHCFIESNLTTLCSDYHSFIRYAGSYMFRHPCAIFRELLISLWVTWRQNSAFK